MKNNIDLEKIYKSKSAFEKLKTITYKDIYINNVGVRILGIHFMECAPEWSTNRHRHSFHEFHYVLNGNVFSTIEGTEYKVLAGNFYLMPPGTYHSHIQKNNIGHIGFAIRWEFIGNGTSDEKGGFPNRGIDKGNIYDDLRQISTWADLVKLEPVVDDMTIFAKFKSLIEMANSKCLPISLQIETVQLILTILNAYSSANLLNKNTKKYKQELNAPVYSRHDKRYGGGEIKSPDGITCSADSTNTYVDEVAVDRKDANKHTVSENRIINASIQFIQDNYCEQIDVFDVANSIHFSYSYLAKLFKRCTGETITQYTNRLRINKAFKLINCTDKKISQIATETGFNTPNYFCMVFRKQFGKTPESIREEKPLLPE